MKIKDLYPDVITQGKYSMRKKYDLTNEKNNKHIKSKVKKFLDTHRDVEFSAAKFEYSIYLYGEASKKAIELVNSRCPKTVTDLEMEKAIIETTEPKEILKLMRKKLSGSNRSLLRDKMLEYEDDLLPMIKERSIRNKQDIFIENALYFFMRSKGNYCDWITDTYSQFQSEYLKSLFCLVLGFRGDISTIPFLMEEAERMEKEYPNEYYDQGPALAVQELAVRSNLIATVEG